MWNDLYQIAIRTEALGHGIYANRGHETRIDAGQLADALVHVLCDSEGETGYRLKQRAGELGQLCRAAEGDRRAAEVVWNAAIGKDVGAWPN
jgi:hypothetical protein